MATKDTWGTLLACPKCHECEVAIDLRLVDTAVFYCHDCEEEFSRKELDEWLEAMQAAMNRWPRILKWIDTLPNVEEGE